MNSRNGTEEKGAKSYPGTIGPVNVIAQKW